MKKNPWYQSGLCFECAKCGRCCSGPGEGYIWVTNTEAAMIARHLGISEKDLRSRYLKRVGWRMSIIEEAATKDCIFLRDIDGARTCAIYEVRPNQCRTWPFWKQNLQSADAWHSAAERCRGMNQGRHYTPDEIERLSKRKNWWDDEN